MTVPTATPTTPTTTHAHRARHTPTGRRWNFNKRADMMIAAKKATKNADKARLHNLSGPSPLYVVPLSPGERQARKRNTELLVDGSRARRQRKAPRLADGSQAVRPMKRTREEQKAAKEVEERSSGPSVKRWHDFSLTTK
ncbi:hypothetical protein C8J57DRAFT_1528295 [Mycena rebaudengoi]|nr:hypothetical protein C8J57DRAFT_1528295 [Mycena rebaudengoi]